MIQITKEEANYLRNYDPSIFIAITGRNKKAKDKRRYVSEDIKILRLLTNNTDAINIVSEYDRKMRTKARWRRG